MSWTPEKAKARRERRHNRKARFLELLGGKCAHCGSTKQLEFDHLDPDEKEFRISKYLDWKDDNLLIEVNKCQLLCKPCHHKKTLEKQEYGKESEHGTLWRYKKYKCRCDKCKGAMSRYWQAIKNIKNF